MVSTQRLSFRTILEPLLGGFLAYAYIAEELWVVLLGNARINLSAFPFCFLNTKAFDRE
jgi:hypothetical protein